MNNSADSLDAPYDPICEAPQWFIFSDAGKACLVSGDTITKAIANWKKRPGKSKENVVGIVKASMPIALDQFALSHTHVFGVICCLQKPKSS